MEDKHLTAVEWGELRDAIEKFKESRVWKHIVVFMQQMYADAAESVLQKSGDANEIAMEARFNAGIAQAVRMISQFDDHIALFKQAQEVNDNGRRKE